MKIANIILKVVAALAAIAGIVYVVATYGDKIVAWAKGLLSRFSCCCGDECCCDDECCCEEGECCCEEECCCGEECCCEEAVEGAVEEAVAEEAPAEEAVAEEADFEG